MTTARTIAKELKLHAPFTSFGAVTGIMLMVVIARSGMSRELSTTLFWTLHPVHVFLSALVTAGMYRLNGKGRLYATILIGYVGSIGIATLSDSLIPYAGEMLLDLPHRQVHLGFIEKWWLVNPLAGAGILVAYVKPSTKLPHAGHVFLSTWASLFHIMMALDSPLNATIILGTALFLFLSVWVPCCTSDIVFPLIFSEEDVYEENDAGPLHRSPL